MMEEEEAWNDDDFHLIHEEPNMSSSYTSTNTTTSTSPNAKERNERNGTETNFASIIPNQQDEAIAILHSNNQSHPTTNAKTNTNSGNNNSTIDTLLSHTSLIALAKEEDSVNSQTSNASNSAGGSGSGAASVVSAASSILDDNGSRYLVMDTITEEDVDEVSVISKGSSQLLMQQQPPHNSPLNMSIKAPKDVPHLALVQEEEVTIDGEEEEEGVTEEREDKKMKGVDVDADANGKIIVEDVTEEELKPSITSTTSATSTTTPPTSPPPATPPQLPPKKASPLANINNNQLNPANSPRAVIDQMNLMTFLKQTTQNKMVLEFDSSKPEFTDADSVLSFDDSRPGTATKSPSSSRPDTGTSYQQPPPPSSQLEKEAISAALNGMSMDDLLSLSSKGDQTVPITNTNSFYNSNYSSDGTTNDNESGVTPTSNTMSPTRHHPNQIPHPHSSTASLPPRLQSVSPKRRRSFFDPSNPTQSQQQQQQYQQHQDPSSSPSPRLSPPPPPEIYKRQPHLSVEEYIKSLALAEAAAKSGASEFTTESKLVILDKLELNAKIQRNLKRQERRKKYERFFSNSRSYFVDAIAGLKETAKTIDANMEKKRLEYVEKKKVEKEWEDLSIGKSFSDDLSVDEEQKVEEKDEGKEEEKEKLKSSMTSKAKQEQKEEQQRVEEDPSSEPLDEILLNEVVVDDNVVLSTSTKEVKHDTATSIQELTKELQQPESQPQDNNDDNDDDNNDDDNTKELNMVMEVVPSSEKKDDVLKETTIQSQ